MNVHHLHDKLNVGVEYGAIINAVAECLEDVLVLSDLGSFRMRC